MKTVWNQEEDDALQGLPLRAQIIYLRGIRRYMDYRSGVCGGAQRRISLLMLAEITQEMVNRQIKPKPSKDAIRAAIDQLKRAGLIERLEEPDYLMFYLPKADTVKFDENNHTITAPQPANRHYTSVVASDNRPDSIHQPITSHPPQTANQPIHQLTDNPIKMVGEDSRPPYQAIVDLYHSCLPNLPKVYKLSDQRKQAIKALWCDELEDLASWKNYFHHIAKSDFLMGRKPGRDGLPFLASFDFIIHPVKFIKIAEEHYHGQKIQKSGR